MDSRADTVCGGATFELYEDTGKVVDVGGFHPTMDLLKDVTVGTIITAVDLPDETIIAVFHQGLYFGDTMEHSLIPPAQLWDYGITCDITPKWASKGKSIHGIYSQDDNLYIPFKLNGHMPYFNTRLPTQEEKEPGKCRWITFTSAKEWEPYSDHFQQSEDATTAFYNDPYHGMYRPTFDHEGNPVQINAVTTKHTTHNTMRYISATSMIQEHPQHDIEPPDSTAIIAATSSKERRTTVPATTLARRWGTSVDTATNTLRSTTQRGLRYLQGDITRRFRTRQTQLQNRLLNTRMYTDTMFAEKQSAQGNTCAQLFVTAEGFADGEPMKSKADAHMVLERICREVGIPKLLVSDGAKEEIYGDWGKIVKHNLIQVRQTEPYSGWQNRCEDEIREVKKHFGRIMALHRCPTAFWDFAWKYTIELRQKLSRKASGDRPPAEVITGESQDISEYTEFDFYQWILYRDKAGYPNEPVKVGRWLGVSHQVGSPLTFWILKGNGQVISRSTVIPMKEEDKPKYKQDMDTLQKTVAEKYTDYDPNNIQVHDNDDMEDPITTESNEADETKEEEDDANGDELEGPSLFHQAEVYMPHGENQEIAKVIGRKRNLDGTYVGKANENPTLDTRVFTIRFPDGDEKDVAYNVIAEHLYSQVDEHGNQYHIYKDIINHRKRKNAVDKSDQYKIGKDRRKTKRKTTIGWDLEVEWKDGSTSWLPLKELKETNAVQVAEYAVLNRIDEEPAFDWWVRDILKKKKRLIKLTKSKHIRRGYKFGIRMPTSVKEALEIDRQNKNTLWYDAIMKEMKNVRVAFDIKERKTKPPPGYKHVNLMMIFDIKMDFTRKARLVARGDQTDPPSTITYSSVVSRESVRLAFLIAALNGLNMKMFDIGNAYLNAPAAEKLYSFAGIEFGEEDQGKLMIISRALYGLKSSGAAYRAHFAQTLTDLGFISCLADADVWRKEASKPDGTRYYEYILTYVDDCLVVSMNPDGIIQRLEKDFGYRLKDVEEPRRYLGAMINKYDMGKNQTWSMSAELYLKRALEEVENKWGNLSKLFRKDHLDIPVPTNYHPELDQTAMLDDDDKQLYQSYIGILRWAVELGRIDIAHSAGVMARFSAAPREHHLYIVLRIMAYCKKHIESKIIFEPTPPDFNDIKWGHYDWKEFYPDALKEELPPRMPEPLGKSVDISIFCDAAHATCHVTRRSTTGIIIFVNGAPISWYSKRQNTIESSVFGSEYVALKIAVEQNEALRYKLRMMGIPITGPSNGFCDNKSVVTNSTVPQSTLQKKHNMVAYHKVRESVAMEAIRITHERGKVNMADVLTKFLPKPAFRHCCQCMMYR